MRRVELPWDAAGFGFAKEGSRLPDTPPGGVVSEEHAASLGCSRVWFCNEGGLVGAGCPAAVGNLWDVTDRDIDRFSKSVLEQWMVSSGEGQSEAVCMAAAVAGSRQVCRLPHLIGAAPVCYGLPTMVQAGSGFV